MNLSILLATVLTFQEIDAEYKYQQDRILILNYCNNEYEYKGDDLEKIEFYIGNLVVKSEDFRNSVVRFVKEEELFVWEINFIKYDTSWHLYYATLMPHIKNLYIEAKNMPKLQETYFLPSYQTCSEMYKIAFEYRNNCEQIASNFLGYNNNQFKEYINEIRKREILWGCALEATRNNAVDLFRRRNMVNLIQKIGLENFYAGNIPSPIP